MKTCTNCILDSKDDPNITFNNEGKCNHCSTYESNVRLHFKGGDPNLKEFKSLIKQIKNDGKEKKYDAIIGLSGGVDSTFVAYLCMLYKIKVLAVHLDNGWNSELSVVNIKNILKRTGFDLFTYVINWEEFRDLQIAYFKADVVDIEVLTDHAIFTVLQKTAIENNIKYVLGGSSITTEGRLPEHWVHNKGDHLNIKAINKKFGTKTIKTFPINNFYFNSLKNWFYKIKYFDILDFYPYDKPIAKKIIINEFNWRDYGGKHYESIFTRFYQAYILPRKFDIDKRKSHFSTLICAGQLSREEAIKLINKPTYSSKLLEKRDYEYVIKKLGFSKEFFDNYIKKEEIPHTHYRSVQNLIKKLVLIKQKLFN